MRGVALAAIVACTACEPEVWLAPNLQQANARASHQTAGAEVALTPADLDQPYDVLADLEVVVRQRGRFGREPTRANVEAVLREQAGRLGAHAVILVSFGQPGSSWWSYNELRAHGRAVRLR